MPIIFSVFCFILNGKLSEPDKVSYDGYIGMRAGYEYKDKYPDLFTRAKIEIELQLTEDIEAQIDIRANSDDYEVELKEIYALFKRYPDFLIKVGNIRKRFGIEELSSKEDLYTIEESLINGYLAPFGYVGRDPGIQIYRKYKDKGIPYSYYFITSINRSGFLIVNSRVSYHNLFGSYCLGLDGIYRRSLPFAENEYPSNSYAMSIGLIRDFGSLYTDAEVFFGMDPIETQLNDYLIDGRDVFFVGVKWLLTYYLNIDNIIQGIEPLFLCSILSPDTRNIDVNKIELLLGINIYLDENVRFGINGDLVLINSTYNTRERAIASESKILLDLLLKW